MSKLQPWEQQNDETELSFSYFSAYLQTDPVERTIGAIYWSHGPGRELDGVARQHDGVPGSWYERAQKHKWEERALAYDRQQHRILLRKLEQRRMKALMETADLGESLRKKAAQAARLLTAVDSVIGQHEGRDVLIMRTALTPDNIVRLAEAGVKIEQLALGNPTERVQVGEDPLNPLGASVDTARQMVEKRLMEIRARRQQAISATVAEDSPAEAVVEPEFAVELASDDTL